MRQTATCGELAKVFVEVAGIIGLVIILRKEFQEPCIIRLIAALERIHEDEAPARLQHPSTFAKNDAAHLWRQFVEQENTRYRVLAFIGHGQRLRISNSEVQPRPALQVMLRVFDIWLGHIEPEGRKPRPCLFEKIEKAPSPAANVEKSQLALITSGKNFMELRQGLPARGIGCPVEEDLDLRVISPRRIIGHPAARLEMKILQKVARPLPVRSVTQDFVVSVVLAAPMDLGEVLEKKAGAIKQSQQRSIMIG